MAGDAPYFQRVGGNWNRFWFLPRDARPLCRLRILVGISALWYLLTYLGHLREWFGPSGLLPAETVRLMTGATGGEFPVYRWSYWYYLDDPSLMTAVLLVELLVVAAFTVGLFTRITSILSWLVIVAHVHRAPVIAGQWEPVLTMLLLYLCIGPSGEWWSIDARRRGAEGEPPAPSMTANLSLRLIQVHLAGFYLLMGLSKLAGDTWWTGEAVWWLIAHSESRLVDLTRLHSAPLLINAWTHSIVLFELAYGTLIWVRDLRPWLLTISILIWLSLALITGLLGFCGIMLIANFAFVPVRSADR